MSTRRADDKRVRWVDYARRSMQRLGHLKILISVASPTNAITLEGLTNRFQVAVTREEPVPEDIRPRVLSFVQEQRLHQRYGDLTETAARCQPFRMQIQDLYLADPRIPSSSGAITGDLDKSYRRAVYVEMPAWAVRLGLLRDMNYTLTDRGRVLRELSPNLDDQLQCYHALDNPYLLSLAERYFFLFVILESDGDLIKGIYDLALKESAETFTRSQVGDWAAETLTQIRRTRLRQPSVGKEQELALKADVVVRSIRDTKTSGMGPKESIATPRTEPLVDCRFLQRADKLVYEYKFTEMGRRIVERIIDASSIRSFLTDGLATAMVADDVGTSRLVEFDDVLRLVLAAYSPLRSGLGYVSIPELCMSTVALALSQGKVTEFGDVQNSIFEAGQQFGRQVRITHGRLAGQGQVRFDLSLVQLFS